MIAGLSQQAAIAMKSASTHWELGAKGSTERGSVPKPPVGIVPKACATAWYRFIRSSTPVHPKAARMRMSSAVRAT